MTRAKGARSKLLSIAIGCFSIILLIVGISGIMLVWAGISYRSLGEPVADDADMAIALGDIPEPASPVPPSGTALATLSPSEFPGGAHQRAPMKLSIALAEGEFEILPGPPGSDITVEGSYATNYYELVDERREGEHGMEVSLRLLPTASWFTRLMAGLNNMDSSHPNDLTVYIPADLPMDLKLRLEAGESRVELGGLTLTDLDVDLSKGDFKLSFDEPLAAPLPSMTLSMQMGDGRASGLGNARASDITVDTGMGDFRLSFAGAWAANSDNRVTVDHSMGDLTLTIPKSVHVAEDSSSMVIFGGSSGRLKDDRDAQVAEDAATLHLDVNTSMGGVNVRRTRSSSSGGG